MISAVLRWLFLGSSLAACAALPDVSYLREGATAPQADSTGILVKQVAAEEAINGTPLVAGNKVTLLDDGPLTMRAMPKDAGDAAWRDTHMRIEGPPVVAEFQKLFLDTWQRKTGRSSRR